MSSGSHSTQAAEHLRNHPVRCAVLTVSDTRTLETDESGQLVVTSLEEAGYDVAAREVLPDDGPAIERCLRDWIDDPAIDAILTTGGTGIAPRDGTIEVVGNLITLELRGFGELFRMLSFEEVGSAAMLSRALGGLATDSKAGGDTFIFAMPGSPNAVRTAMTRLVVPELSHLVWQRKG